VGVISRLATLLGFVKISEYNEIFYKSQELQKCLIEAKRIINEEKTQHHQTQTRLANAEDEIQSAEVASLEAQERAALAVARIEGLQSEIKYLREQVAYYQGQLEISQKAMMTRLGLLPQEQQGQIDKEVQKPLRSARIPFAVAQARIQTQRKEEYWKARANEVDLTGTVGTTSGTETVSDKEA